MENEIQRDLHKEIGRQLDLHSRDSYLSARVKRLICELGLSLEDEALETEDIQNIFIDTFILDLETIGKALPDINDIEDEDRILSEEWYLEATYCLSTIMKTVANRIERLSKEDISLFLENLTWTKHTEVFQKSLDLLKCSNNQTDSLLVLLLITPVVERALGNVYLLKSSPVPFLLKDLLASVELQQIFGIHALSILQVLIGPPISLNLRNVGWHGFLAPHELSKNYCYFLIAVLASLNQKLIYQDIIPSAIPERPLIDLTEYGTLEECFPELNNSRIKSLKNIILNSCFVPSLFIDVWLRAIEYLVSKRFTDYVILMLPQLEHSLRRIFALVNKCPEKVMTAESSVFYVTFDEIISEYLPSGEPNQVKDIIDTKNMEVLFDLLSHLEGPRLRDHISHGEVNLAKFPAGLCKQVVFITASLCILFVRNASLLQDPFTREIIQLIEDYVPKYSPISLLIKQVKELIDDMYIWKDAPVIQKPNNISVEEIPSQEMEIKVAKIGYLDWPCEDKYLNLMKLMWSRVADLKFLDKSQVNNLSFSQGDLTSIKNIIENLHPAVLYPSKEKIEVVGHLRHIARNSFVSSRQIQNCLKLKCQQYCNHELRSRQRMTYWRMINVLIRIVTQYVENLKVMTQADKNRWEESGKLTAGFSELLSQYLPAVKVGELQ